MKKPKVTIAIPAYNASKTIADSIRSAITQRCKGKEILVYDDASADLTASIAGSFKEVRVVSGEENIGIGAALVRLLDLARGKYVIFLCADDLFTNPFVADDVIREFEADKEVGVIGRHYYEFIDGKAGPVGVFRDPNIITGSCNPSGISLRRTTEELKPTDRTFIEMPYIIKQYLMYGYKWSMFNYDVIAVRIHPGGNTGTKTEYYGTQSPTMNWYNLMDQGYIYFPELFIQLKNRAPRLLWQEICLNVKLEKSILLKPSFWLYSMTALIVSPSILREMSAFVRDKIRRRFVTIKERPNNV